MIRKGMCALALCTMLLIGCAAAQTLPDNAVFSPGLMRLSQAMAGDPVVTAQAQVSVDDAFYARDLSVLSAMLEGTTLRYQGGGGAAERLFIERGGEMIAQYALDNVQIQHAGAAKALERLQGTAILERVPLAAVADWLESLQPGDGLPFGFSVTQAVSLRRTMSDDGTRLTRVDLESGAIAREGEAPYAITGYMRQPAGRAPKDTFELVLRQDERNFLELSYSALRESTVKSRNKAGETSVRTSLKAAGKIAGSGVSSRLTVNMTNAWTADGDALSEKVTVSASLSHQDNTPGRRMQRLNRADVSLKNVIRLTTHEGGDEAISLTDSVTLKAVMDDNTFLNAKMEAAICAGGEAMQAQADAPAFSLSDDAAAALAARIYPQLPQAARDKAEKGL